MPNWVDFFSNVQFLECQAENFRKLSRNNFRSPDMDDPPDFFGSQSLQLSELENASLMHLH